MEPASRYALDLFWKYMRHACPFAMRLQRAALLQSAAGGLYRNGELVHYRRSIEERTRPGATAIIRIECGAGRVCRSLQQPREQACARAEKKASPHERQGPGRNPTRSKGPVGKGQGGQEVVCLSVAIPSSRLWRPASPPGWTGGTPVIHPHVPARLARCAA